MVLSRSRAAVAACTALLFAVTAAQASAATVDPSSFDYGDQRVDEASAAKSFVLTNDGSAAVEIGAISISGPGTSIPFALDFAGTTCLGAVLAPGDTCTTAVKFTPASAGFHPASLSFQDNNSNAVGPIVSLSGNGVAWLELTPASFDFGDQTLSTIGVPKAFTVTAHGGQTPGPAQVVGTNRDDFLITQNDCSSVPLANHATCEVHLRFAPSALGARSATLQFVTANQFFLEAVTPTAQIASSDLSGNGTPVPPGPPGPQGPVGPQGPAGPQGAAGANGAAGAAGATGPTGPAGAQGPEGDDGLNGTNGRDGIDGTNGRDGRNGADGAAGASGQIALSQDDPRSASLLQRNVRLIKDTVTLHVRCPIGPAVSTGTVKLRTRGALGGSRRTVGAATFSCPSGQSRTVQVFVRATMRALLRRHRGATGVTAYITTRDRSGGLIANATPLQLALGHRRP